MSDVTIRIRRYLVYTLIILTLVVLLALTVVSTFLATEGGSRLISEYLIESLNEDQSTSISVETIRGNLLQGLRFDGVRFAMEGFSGELDSLSTSWNPLSLLGATFQLYNLDLTGLTIELDSTDAATTAADPVQAIAFEPLPIGIAIDQVRVEQVEILGQAEPLTIQTLQARVSLEQRTLQIAAASVVAPDFDLGGQLVLELTEELTLRSTIAWQYQGELPLQLESAAGELVISGSLENLQLQHQLDAPFSIRTSGSIQNVVAGLESEFNLIHRSAQLSVPLEPTNPQLSNVTLTTRSSEAGVVLELETTVQAAELPAADIDVTAILAGQQLLVERASIDSAGGSLLSSLQIDWTTGLLLEGSYELSEPDPLRFILEPPAVTVSDLSSTGEFRFDRGDAGQNLYLTVSTLAALVEQQALTGTGQINLVDDSWQVERLLLAVAGNSVNVQGSYGDEINLDWDLAVNDIQRLLPEYAGSINGSGFVRGDLQQPLLQGDLQIDNLQAGSLRLQSVLLALAGTTDEVELSLDIENAIYQDEELEIAVSQAAAGLTGSLENHQFSTSLQSNFGDLQLELSGGFSDFENRAWGGEILSAGVQNEFGNWQAQPARLTATLPDFSLADSCWRLQTISVCLNLNSNAGVVVIEGDLQGFPLTEFNAGEEPEHLFSPGLIPRLPADVSLAGTLASNFSARLQGEQPPTVLFSATTADTALQIRQIIEDEFSSSAEQDLIEQNYIWRSVEVSGEYSNSAWVLQGLAELAAQNVQDSDFSLDGVLEANINISATGDLSGTTRARFDDLGWVAAFLTEVSDVTGNLQSNLTVSGNLDAPDFSGEINLNQGSFISERLGVGFEDIEARLFNIDADTMGLEGSVTGGDGFLAFSGSADNFFAEDRQITADLLGENFQFASTPDMEIRLSPALLMSANADLIELRGALTVPQFRLNIRELPPSAVDISRDVIIVDYPADRPELSRSITADQASLFDIPVFADVSIELGDEVSVSGFGLTAALAGGLQVQQFANGSNFTYGELAITEGSYQVYGRSLTLRDGKLLFLGNYDNPALDVRAVREVGDMTVGVLMNGTVKNIESRLFSTPDLPDNDIIAVLITGRPFSQMQSSDGNAVLGAIANLGIRQGASLTADIGARLGVDTLAVTNTGDISSTELVIGKYLTPQIFVRYGLGLFDEQSKVAVDYKLNDRVTLQAESGEYQSVDVIYRVER